MKCDVCGQDYGVVHNCAAVAPASMTQEAHQRTEAPLSKALRIAAGYMLLSGIIGLVWPLLNLGPHHAQYEAQSFAYKLGAQFRELTINALFIIAGIGLFRRRVWARSLALGSLVLAAADGTTTFAWGFAGGPPSSRVYLFSGIVNALWDGLWFYLIRRPAYRPNKSEGQVP